MFFFHVISATEVFCSLRLNYNLNLQYTFFSFVKLCYCKKKNIRIGGLWIEFNHIKCIARKVLALSYSVKRTVILGFI